MKILITGATGGLGQNLVPYFVGQGHVVTAIGRNNNIGKSLEAAGAKFFSGDISDRKFLSEHIQGQDVVIHSAALAAPWGKWADFKRINVEGTKILVDLAIKENLKSFVHLSTPSIYFSGTPRTNIKESDPLPDPHTHYARSKIMAEKIITDAVAEHSLPAVMLRPRALFGPHDTAVLPRLLRVMEKGFFPLPNGGSALTNVTYVGNVVHAVDLAMKAQPSCYGKAYNITNGEALSIKELGELLADKMKLKVKFINVPLSLLLKLSATMEFVADHVTHKEPTLTNYSVGLLGISQTLDITRAEQELGYRPQVSVRQGLDQFLEWRKKST